MAGKRKYVVIDKLEALAKVKMVTLLWGINDK